MGRGKIKEKTKGKIREKTRTIINLRCRWPHHVRQTNTCACMCVMFTCENSSFCFLVYYLFNSYLLSFCLMCVLQVQLYKALISINAILLCNKTYMFLVLLIRAS